LSKKFLKKFFPTIFLKDIFESISGFLPKAKELFQEGKNRARPHCVLPFLQTIVATRNNSL
jgi:hypothetical protein